MRRCSTRSIGPEACERPLCSSRSATMRTARWCGRQCPCCRSWTAPAVVFVPTALHRWNLEHVRRRRRARRADLFLGRPHHARRERRCRSSRTACTTPRCPTSIHAARLGRLGVAAWLDATKADCRASVDLFAFPYGDGGNDSQPPWPRRSAPAGYRRRAPWIRRRAHQISRPTTATASPAWRWVPIPISSICLSMTANQRERAR